MTTLESAILPEEILREDCIDAEPKMMAPCKAEPSSVAGKSLHEYNGIRYVKLKHSNDLIKTAQSIKEAFRKCHTFFQTNDEEDIEILRTRFQNWRKQK